MYEAVWSFRNDSQDILRPAGLCPSKVRRRSSEVRAPAAVQSSSRTVRRNSALDVCGACKKRGKARCARKDKTRHEQEGARETR
eukprot:5050092-Pleurochrysis_carterae.AAC.2